MTTTWDLVRMGGTLSLPYVRSVSLFHLSEILTVPIARLPIALLQLPTAFGNTMLRTLVILAFLLATSSLVTASFFIASKELLTSAAKRKRWLDASMCPKLFHSIDFWLCLSWPVTSFVWWVINIPRQRLWNAHGQNVDTHLLPHVMQVHFVIPSCSYLACHDQSTWSYIRRRWEVGCCTSYYHLGSDSHLWNILPYFQIRLCDKELILVCSLSFRWFTKCYALLLYY